MLLALQDLADAGYEANAHGCREWGEALALLRARKAAGTLPHMVVIALGADGSVTHDDIGATLGLLCCTRLLVLVTPRELGGGSGSDALTVREEVQRHQNRTRLLDWVRYSAGHGGWFQPDGLHLTTDGALAFTNLLKRALPWAYPKPKPAPPQGSSGIIFNPPSRPAHGARQALPGALSIRPSLAHTGYVGARISGPPGVEVQIGEQRRGSVRPIGVVTLGPRGGADVPRALTWACSPRRRDLVAATLAPAASQRAAATVTTPSCARRLAVRVSGHGRGGRGLEVRVQDRWGLGALTYRICAQPPGGTSDCRPWQLVSGQADRSVSLPAPRVGGWAVDVFMTDARRTRKVIWVAPPDDPIRLLAAGDSEMQEVDDFLGADLGGSHVKVTEDARISTGLTNPSFFDWPAHARRQAASLRPDVTVMFMGANEGFPIPAAHGPAIFCCASAWRTAYADVVAGMMRSYLRRDAGRVYWFLLPTPRAANFKSVFDAVNAGVRAAASRFPGRAAVIDADAFFTPHDRYRDFMTWRGRGFVVHDTDGVHLSTTANDVAASLIVRQLRADRVIRPEPGPSRPRHADVG
jgi:hypothetical protein